MRVVVVPPGAEMWPLDPPPPVQCLDCDVELEPMAVWQVAQEGRFGGSVVVSPLCRVCADRRWPR